MEVKIAHWVQANDPERYRRLEARLKVVARRMGAKHLLHPAHAPKNSHAHARSLPAVRP